jgi:hypothetical protein
MRLPSYFSCKGVMTWRLKSANRVGRQNDKCIGRLKKATMLIGAVLLPHADLQEHLTAISRWGRPSPGPANSLVLRPRGTPPTRRGRLVLPTALNFRRFRAG